MADPSIIKKLIRAIGDAKRPGAFCCSGSLQESKPKLTILNAGPIKLPLRPAGVRKLIDSASQAPYGQGVKTIIDTSVRDTLEIQPDVVELSDAFQETVEAAVAHVAEELGLDHQRLSIELYKLLIYQKGGFFLPHRDSEKRRGMVASLIVVLPSKFGGGELVVEHEGRRKTFPFDSARAERAAEYVAFFADCRHEVRKVRSGVRVCLAYNLMLRPARKTKVTSKSDSDPRLLQAVGDWMRDRGEDAMVFALEHQYTQDGLKPDLLKGADRFIFQQLAAAAEHCHCRLHLGQVSRHLCQFADDGSFGYGRRRYRGGPVDYNELEVGEVYEDEIVVDGWKDAQGKRASLGDLTCDSSMLISTTPVDQWKPTRQDYEGYTGNAGNTLDRWYHKSAIVLWSDKHHFDVIAQMGLPQAIKTLMSMRARLAKAPKSKLEQARGDCKALAEAIIRRWPNRIYGYYRQPQEDQSHLADFTSELSSFDDPDLVGQFLQTIAQRDWTLSLDKFVLTCCKSIGADVIAPLLVKFIQTEIPANKYGRRPEGLPKRDASWLAKICQDRTQGGLPVETIDQLLDAAIQQFADHAESAERERYHRDSGMDETWLLLCKAALCHCVSGADVADSGPRGQAEPANKLFGMAATLPRLLDLRKFQAKAAGDLYAWSAKRFDEVPSLVTNWIADVRSQLSRATQEKPKRPTDFARRADAGCDCPFCEQLQAFLSDPNQETTKIAAREDRRAHLEYVIRSKGLDVASKLDRSKRPYALALTKTIASYERDLKQYESDLKLLASLPS